MTEGRLVVEFLLRVGGEFCEHASVIAGQKEFSWNV